jgi:hypothetical protein
MRKLLVVFLITALLFGWFQVNPALASTNTFQVSSLSDAVNEDGATFTSGSSTVWLGNGNSATASFTGIRFTNVMIPNGATITSAKLKVYSTQSQWISIRMSMAGDLSANSPAFSSTNKPSQRGLTTQKVNHSSNVSWVPNTWYTLDEMAPVVQEIVNLAAWQSGNSFSIILKGTGNSWGRKVVAGWSSANNNGPQLVITYSTSTPPTVTATSQVNTSTPTLALTSTSLPSTPTRTSTPLSPSPTLTRTATTPPFTPTFTRTSTTLPATPTLTATSGLPTSTPGASNTTAFSIGPGWADTIPHQLVRTSDDRVYFFGVKGESSAILYAYWTTASGYPNKGSDFSGTVQINNGANILSCVAIYDGAQIIHVLTNAQDGKITDRPFDISTNQFKTAKILDTVGATVSGYYIGTSGITGMSDPSGIIHVAYWAASNHIIYRAYTYNRAQDILALVSGPTQLDSNGSANHPVLAISPLDSSVTIAWVSQSSSPAQILAKTRKSGAWGSLETVSNAPVWTSTSSGINIDQGPSLVIGPDGTKYLTYIENWRVTAPYDYGRVHYVTNNGSGWSDQYIGSYTHDPALALNSAGQIYIIGHGYPLNSACTSENDLCIYQRNSDGTWATPKLFLAHQGTQSFDTSISVKWSVVGFNRPETIEFFFSDDGAGYSNPILYYGRIGLN